MNEPAVSKGSRQRASRDASKTATAPSAPSAPAPTPPPVVQKPAGPAGSSQSKSPVSKGATAQIGRVPAQPRGASSQVGRRSGQTDIISSVSTEEVSAPAPQTSSVVSPVVPSSARKAESKPAAGRPVAKGRLNQTARQAHLRVTKLDLLAVLKMSFLFAFCVSIVIFVALFAVWHILVSTGVIGSAQSLLNSVLGSPTNGGNASVQLSQYLNSSRVVGFIAGISVINVFILTLLGTIFGGLYNLASVLFGGVEVTLEV